MSKASELACAIIGAGLGFDCSYVDRCDHTNADEDILLYAEAAYYGPIAAAAVEAAYTVTFDYPKDWQYTIYKYFGEMIDDATETDNEDDGAGTHVLPDRDVMRERLINLVYDEFAKVATESQKPSLRAAITQAVQDAA